MNKFLFGLVIILINLFYSYSSTQNHLIEADKIIKKFKNSLNTEGIKLTAVGGGFFDSIESFSFEYDIIADSQSIDLTRDLIVKKTEEFIRTVNNPTAIPFLKNYPFDENFLILAFNFIDKKGEFIYSNNKINRIFLFKGKLIYSSFFNDKFHSLHEELYAEAYQKVYGVPLPDRSFQFGVK